MHSVPEHEPETPTDPPADVNQAPPSPGLPIPQPDIEPPVQIPERASS